MLDVPPRRRLLDAHGEARGVEDDLAHHVVRTQRVEGERELDNLAHAVEDHRPVGGQLGDEQAVARGVAVLGPAGHDVGGRRRGGVEEGAALEDGALEQAAR